MNIHPPDKVLSELLARSRLTPGRDLAELVTRAGRQMGLTCTAVYVADLQQDTLQALPQSPAPEDPASAWTARWRVCLPGGAHAALGGW